MNPQDTEFLQNGRQLFAIRIHDFPHGMKKRLAFVYYGRGRGWEEVGRFDASSLEAFERDFRWWWNRDGRA